MSPETRANFKAFFGWAKGFLSEPDGTASGSRGLMWFFAIVTASILGFIFRHLMYMTDTVALNIWLSNLPLLIAAFMGLISLAYGFNQGGSVLGNIATMIGNIKSGGAMVGGVGDRVLRKEELEAAKPSPASAAPTPAVQMGSSGEKG